MKNSNLNRSYFIVWLVCFLTCGVGIYHAPPNWPSDPGSWWMILMPLGLIGAFANLGVHIHLDKKQKEQI